MEHRGYPMAVNCPCCGQPLAETSDDPAVLLAIRVSPQERAALTELITVFPGGLDYGEVRSIIYGGGSADQEDKVTGIVVHRLRRKIAAMGWSIPDGRTVGEYRLVRT